MKEDFKLDFIWIWAHKAWTTWVVNMLKQHPEIFIPNIKEIQFFNDFSHFSKPSTKRYLKGNNYYKTFFKFANKKQKLWEFSVSYMNEQLVAERIYKHNSNIKIIVVLRNPIDRAYSAYFYLKEQLNNSEKSKTFEEAIEKNPIEYLERWKYYKYLSNYFSIFPKENIKILFFEDIKFKPEKVLKELCIFLNINNKFKFKNISKKSNSSKKRKNIFLSKILSFLFKTPDFLEKIKLRFITDFIWKLWIRKMLNKIREKNLQEYTYPEIDKNTKEKLKKYFIEDIENLEKFLNRDLSHWKK